MQSDNLIEIYGAPDDLQSDLSEEAKRFLPVQTQSTTESEIPTNFDDAVDSDDEFSYSTIDAGHSIVQSRIRNFLQYSVDSDNEHPGGNICNSGEIVDQTTEVDSDYRTGADNDDFLKFTETRDGCTNKCLIDFTYAQVAENRLNIQELDRESRDMLIMGILQGCEVGKNDSTSAGPGPRKRRKFCYRFFNHDVCIDCFLYIYNISLKYLKNIKKHLFTSGLTPRVHGNSSRKPHNALTYEDVKSIVQFITRFADLNGMPQPAVPRGRTGIPPILLPCQETFKSVHSKYTESCRSADINFRIISYTSFIRIWHQCLPHILFITPQTDVCHICEQFKIKVKFSISEEDKLQATSLFTQHIKNAQDERNFYNTNLSSARTELLDHPVQNVSHIIPCSQNLFNVHYTFDFAQNILIPTHCRQEGALYYKSPLKLYWFGVCNNGRPLQQNYLFSEADSIGPDGGKAHAANSVVSMLHHFFQTFSEGEQSCVLNADNCGGQNKNQILTSYLCWRVMAGLHKNIYFHFLKPYHARCLVDGMFGLGRKSLRSRNCDSVSQAADIITKSSKCNNVISFRDPGGQQQWNWRDWKSFFKNMFKPVPNIQSFQHFRFSADEPGFVFVKDSAGSCERKIKILKAQHAVCSSIFLPEFLYPAGLTSKRSWYLYKHVRPFVHDPYKDITFPSPNCLEPSIIEEE